MCFIAQRKSSFNVKSPRSFLHIGSWNVQGLSNKCLDSDFVRVINNFDIACIQETWLSSSHNVCLNGYSYFRSDRNTRHRRSKRAAGGTVDFFKSSLKKGVQKLGSKISDFLWIKLDRKVFSLNKDIFICCVYIPPQGSVMHIGKEYFETLQSEMLYYSVLGDVILLGDFNARTGGLQDFIKYDDIT